MIIVSVVFWALVAVAYIVILYREESNLQLVGIPSAAILVTYFYIPGAFVPTIALTAVVLLSRFAKYAARGKSIKE